MTKIGRSIRTVQLRLEIALPWRFLDDWREVDE